MSDVSGASSTPSGMTGAGGGQLLRITGMASGLDVDGMVKKMMLGEQAKVDQVKQDQQLIQWKQEAYQDIIKDIKDLQSSFFDATSSSSNILSSSNYAAFDVTPSDSTIIGVTAGVGAQAGNYSVSFGSDGQMASAAIKTGCNIATSGVVTQSNWASQKIGFSINGAADSIITLTDGSVTDINNQIANNVNLNGKVQAVLTSDNKIMFQALTSSTVKISSTNTTVTSDMDNLKGKIINPSLSTTMSDLGLTSDSSISFNFNGSTTPTTIIIKTTDKISDVINNITTKTSGAVTSSFSQLTGQFSIKTANTGSTQNLQITDTAVTGAEEVLGLTKSDGTADNTVISGNDAIVYITPPGGTATRVVKSSNNFTIDGINYNLLQKANSSFTVTSDTQKVHDKIKSFLDKYNAIVDKIQTKLNEKKNSDYKPLTDAQKSQMKDADITAWNDKAKQGVLRNDDNLENLLLNLRQAFTSPLKDSSGNSLVSVYFGQNGPGAIGLDTSNDYNQGGKITIVDDTKLNNAIAQYGDQIMKLFTNTSTSTDNTTNFNESGIFQRINNILNDNVGLTGTSLNSSILTKYANLQDDYSISGGAGTNTLPDQIYYKQLLIKSMTDAMNTKQEKYYQQFSQLETVMNQLNNQQSQLSAMLNG